MTVVLLAMGLMAAPEPLYPKLPVEERPLLHALVPKRIEIEREHHVSD